MASYNDKHRSFLQAIMQRGVVSDEDAKSLVIKIFNTNEEILGISTFINRKLESLNMLIKAVICEVSGKTYWMLVSTVLDNVIMFQVEFSQAKLEFLRKVFSEIIASANGSILSTTCLNFCPSMENKFSKTDADEFLNDMLTRKWLTYQNGKIYMGVRGIGELMPYFHATYEKDSFNKCLLCRQIIFYGRKCPHCGGLLHQHCLVNYTLVEISLKCPSCHKPIPVKNLLEDSEDTMEQAAEEVDDDDST